MIIVCINEAGVVGHADDAAVDGGGGGGHDCSSVSRWLLGSCRYST
jgi:hypothetical protein